jgi:hypothetical protein
MDSKEIQQKVTELRSIMAHYKNDLGKLDKELYCAIMDYENAMKKEKLEEAKADINKSLP